MFLLRFFLLRVLFYIFTNRKIIPFGSALLAIYFGTFGVRITDRFEYELVVVATFVYCALF